MTKSLLSNEKKTIIIDILNLKRSFKLGKLNLEILKGINLTVYAGEFIAIMGPSDSGKSTLLNILGLLDYPTEGVLSLSNQNVSALSLNDSAYIRNKKIGFIFQSFNLLPKLTALENVLVPSIFAGTENKSKAVALLTSVGLADRLNHFPNELSGGQKQRVAIARSLMNDPDILLADEPTGNLDSFSGSEIMNIIVGLHKQGKTIIMVTHDDSLAKLAARVVHIKDGIVEKIL